MSAVVLGTVVAVHRLSPSFTRITLSGCGALQSGGYDQRIKILLPLPGQDRPALPDADDWYASYRAMPDTVRPTMRTFTIRAQYGDQIDIEFALHGDAGPASEWAGAAQPGDHLGIIGPAATDGPKALQYNASGASWQLLAGDETALPAVASIIEALPADAVAHVFLQVPDPGDVRSFAGPAGLRATWVVGSGLLDAVRRTSLPATGTAYAWIAGEAGLTRDLRRHLLTDRGWPRADHYFGGYWKAGHSEGT